MAPSDAADAHIAYLSSILDCTSDALFMAERDPAGEPGYRIRFVNDAFTRLTGYALGDAAGMPPTFLCAGCNDPSVIEQVGAAFERGQKATFLLMNTRKDGSRFGAELSINPLFDNGRCDRVLAIHRPHPHHVAGEAVDGAGEAQFQLLANNLTEAVLIYRDGQPLFANQAYVALFGYSTMAEALREISPLMNLRIEESGAGGAPPDGGSTPARDQPVRCEAFRTDGVPLRLMMRSHSIDWRGSRATMLTIERDRRPVDPARSVRRLPPRVTESAGAAMRDDARLLHEIMDSVPVILAHKTRDLRYSYINRTYADWVGLPRDRIIGRHVGEVRNEAHFQLMKARRADVLSGKTVCYVTKCEFPGRGMCDLLTTLSPQRNAAGEVEGYFTLAQDITDLKDIERALRQREQQLRLVVDSVPALISYRDRNLRYQYVNRQYHEWYGVRREDMIGRHMTEFVDLERFRRLKPYIDRVLAGERVRHTQSVDFPGVGERRVQIEFIPHENENGHVVGFFSLSQEISSAGGRPRIDDRRADYAAADRMAGLLAGGE